MSASSDYVAENKILALLYVANGVTTVRNMWGHQAILDLAKDIEAGNLIGPHIYSTGPVNDGVPQVWQGSRAIEIAAEAEEAARADKKAGYIALKVYDRLSADAYNSLVTAGKSQGLPIVGHVPSAVGLRGALAAHQYSVEHLAGYLAALQPNTAMPIPSSSQSLLQGVDFTKLPELVQETKASGTWNCPTLVVRQSIPEDAQWQQRLALIPPALVERYRKGYPNWGTKPDIDRMAYQVNIAITKGLHEGGAKLLLGTDAYKPSALPGFSLHDELRNFVAAGLTPYEAIRAGTIDAALFLSQQNEFGTVTVGLRADLLLLEANPLENVANVTKPVGVMLRGKWLPEEDLQKRLSSLSSHSN
jgi:imidazolonepropionase-like amidohydrolase